MFLSSEELESLLDAYCVVGGIVDVACRSQLDVVLQLWHGIYDDFELLADLEARVS